MFALGGDSSRNFPFPFLFASSALRSLSYSVLGCVEINRYHIPLGAIEFREVKLDSEVGYNIPFLVWVWVGDYSHEVKDDIPEQ